MDASTSPGQIVIERRRFDALLFDLDGVVTKTAAVHARAWKRLFDEYLGRRAQRGQEPFVPFDEGADYRRFVDGKPRHDGIRSFLSARGITLADGDPSDGPDVETVYGLGRRKNRSFQESLERDGVDVYPRMVAMLRDARARGFKLAVVSSSRNCAAVVKAAGLDDAFDTRVDGVVLEELGLAGKPDPALFVEAARRLGVSPERAVVLEDAASGVQAGRDGRFGLVIGVDRGGQAELLRRHGAHVVVADAGPIVLAGSERHSPSPGDYIPSALERFSDLVRQIGGRQVAVFLDYDGTLTPIVDRPELAVLDDAMRATIRELAQRCPVAIISGRDLANVEALVGLESVYYAGSHGFDISGPHGLRLQHEGGVAAAPKLRSAEEHLRARLAPVTGAAVEGKAFAVAVHYRLTPERDVSQVAAAVDRVAAEFPELRVTGGKKIFELRPRVAWDKGRAVLWLLDALGLERDAVCPIYIGDDVTDEDAFRGLAERGIGIVVRDRPAETAARYALTDPNQVRTLLGRLAAPMLGSAP